MNAFYVLCEWYTNTATFFHETTVLLTLNRAVEAEQGLVMKGAFVAPKDRLHSAQT